MLPVAEKPSREPYLHLKHFAPLGRNRPSKLQPLIRASRQNLLQDRSPPLLLPPLERRKEFHCKGVLGVLGPEPTPLPVHYPGDNTAIHNNIARRQVPVGEHKPAKWPLPLPFQPPCPPFARQPEQAVGHTRQTPLVKVLLVDERPADHPGHTLVDVTRGPVVHAADMRLRAGAHVPDLLAELGHDGRPRFVAQVGPHLGQAVAWQSVADHRGRGGCGG